MTEDEYTASLFAKLPPLPDSVVVPPGDDCAALQTADPKCLQLVAVDQLVGERHFLLRGENATAPESAGRKLLARNLSDIAAMGGTPETAVVAVAIGPDQSLEWLNGFMAGIAQLAEEYGVAVVGGDLARTPNDIVGSLTILGSVASNNVVRRRGARAGDALYATGRFGASFASEHHLRFLPRCVEGKWLAGRGLARAMIDVSDGLLLDAGRLARASGLSVHLDAQTVPPRVPEVSTQAKLTDGEDYELLFAVAPENAERLAAEWPFGNTPLSCIGTFHAQKATPVLSIDGQPFPFAQAGFDHFVD